MTAYGAHSSTSMAVKAVVKKVKEVLAKRFVFLESFPDFFYDFDNGVTPQFRQYYVKIPMSQRTEPWVVLSYTYQSAERSQIQPRRGFKYYRPVKEGLKRKIGFQYQQLPLLFSVLSNDSKYLNALANYIQMQLDWSITCSYEDLLWPLWKANAQYPLGWYVRPSVFNGKLYMCTTKGLSGEKEPEWQLEDATADNEVEWTSVAPDILKVKAGTFVKNNTIISNPIENGIMYQYDFGFTLHYTDYDDLGDLVGIIDDITLNLLDDYYDDEIMQTIRVRKESDTSD